MKSIVLFAMLLSLSNLTAQPQETGAPMSTSLNETFSTTDYSTLNVEIESVNAHYLKKVTNTSTSFAKKLEVLAANYDVTKMAEYNVNEPSKYYVTFKNKQGNLYVTYNHEGQIIASKEQFNDIALPTKVRIAIAKQYPKWKQGSNSCQKEYSVTKGLKTTYEVEVTKDDITKVISINNQDVIL